MKNKMTYSEIEGLIPDYVLDRLDSKTKLNFEASILEYNDLLQEVENAKETFELFDKFDLKATIKQESKNLGVKVQEKRSKKSIKSPLLTYLPKYVYPSIGLLVIIYFFFFSEMSIFNKKESQYSIFRDNEVIESFDEANVLDYLVEPSYYSSDLEFINEEDLYLIDLEDLNEETYHYDKFHYDEYLNTLNEKEFNIILKELKDEKIGV
jgi:hypothetical protein